MAIIMGKGCIEAIYGLMGWKGLSMIMNVFLIQIHLFTPDYVEKKYCPIILLLKARTQEPCKAIAQCFNLSIPTWETNLN